MTLPDDATIADIAPKLNGPKEYVRRVLENMIDFRKEHGAAVVRIGTTGTGFAPHYRIQKSIIDSATEIMVGIESSETDEAEYFQAFHGRSHKRLDLGSAELRTEHWSRRSMTFDETQNLLGKLRGFRQ